MTRSMADTCWNGVILLLSMCGVVRKSSITQSSSLLPQLSMGDHSGLRSTFTSAHAKCPEAGNSMKKGIQTGIARLTPKKQAAVAR